MKKNHLRWFFLILAATLIAASVLLPTLVVAEPATDACSNPHDAANSLFIAPSPEQACVNAAAADKGRLTVQLRDILDARGLYVPVDSLSEDPTYEPEDGSQRIDLLPTQAPWLVLTRDQEGRWAYSKATMRQVPQLHESAFSGLSTWFQTTLSRLVPSLGPVIWQYAFTVMLVLVALLIGVLTRLVVLWAANRTIQRLQLQVSRDTLRRLNLPVIIVVASAIVYWRLPDIRLPIDLSVIAYLVLSVVIGLAGIFVASRLVDVGMDIWAGHTENTESKLDDQLVPLVRQLTKVAVWAIGLVFVLQNNGVEVWSFVAGLGIGSLAFALAAQDTIANLFGAFNIFLDRPFQIGDVVKVGGVEGSVEEVGLRSFRVRTFYNSVVTIPNSSVTNTDVDNLGRRPRRRVSTTVGLTYDTSTEQLQAFIEGVRAVLAAHPKVDQSYEVHFNNFGASSLDVLVYYHINVTTWTEELQVRSHNFMEFMRLAEALGVDFAFPTQSVYVTQADEPPGQALPHDELGAIAASFGPDGKRSRPDGPTFGKSFSPKALANAEDA